MEKPFGNTKGNPRYIYFIGKSDYIEKWLEKSKKARETHKNSLDQLDDSNLWYYDDDNGDSNNKGRNCIHSSHDVNTTDIREQKIPLSLYWFVDEDKSDD